MGSRSWLMKSGISAVLVCVLLFAANAEAFWRQLSNTDCQAAFGASTYTDENTSTTNSVILRCSIIEDETFDRTGQSVEVTVRDNHTSQGFQIARCEDFYNVTGGRCATAASTTGPETGIKHVQPLAAGAGFTVWLNPFDSFAYLQVVIPPKQGSSAASRVQGYFVEK